MHPHRLFAKIFLWFWLAIILMASAAVLVSTWIRNSIDPADENVRMVARMTQDVPAHMAVDMLERFGPERLREHLDLWERHTGHVAALFDEHGKAIAGGQQSPEAVVLAERARKSGQVEVDRTHTPPLAAVPVDGRDKRHYVYVAQLPPRPLDPAVRSNDADRPGGMKRADGERPMDGRGPHERLPWPRGEGGRPPFPPSPFGFLLNEPERLAFVILVVVIIGGAVCYWLSRYLTGPLATLRVAAGQLAEGDLSVRVGAALGGRKDEIADLARDFDRMAERLQALLTSERQLLRDISHELRSPLARLNIALGIARQHGADPATTGESLDRIEAESLRVNELIEQLLTLTRLEAGIDQSHRSRVDLEDVVAQASTDAEYEARSRGIRVLVTDTAECPVDGDLELLRRAVENVVRNAVYYTNDDTSIEINLARREAAGAAFAELAVRDHGPGLPEAALSEVFRPFYRAQSGRERNTGGVGLGLAITDRAVHAHGGKVTAANAPDGGLIVTITLPLSAPRLPGA